MVTFYIYIISTFIHLLYIIIIHLIQLLIGRVWYVNNVECLLILIFAMFAKEKVTKLLCLMHANCYFKNYLLWESKLKLILHNELFILLSFEGYFYE